MLQITTIVLLRYTSSHQLSRQTEMPKVVDSEELIRRALNRKERQAKYDRERYLQRKNELVATEMEAHSTTKKVPRRTPIEQQCAPLPIKETRKETEFVECSQCNHTISHQNAVRCVMCAEPRLARAKCLELPMADADVNRLYGFNGSSAFICSRCARHINTYKDTVILRSALTNGIMNANKLSEAKITELEMKLAEERKRWSAEKQEIIEQRDNALRRYKKNSAKHRGGEVFNDIREMNVNFIREIRRAVLPPPKVQTRHWGSQTINKSKKSSSSDSSNDSGSDKDSSSSEDDGAASTNEVNTADRSKQVDRCGEIHAPNLSEDSDSGEACSGKREHTESQSQRKRPHGSINLPKPCVESTGQPTEEYDPLKPQILLWPRPEYRNNVSSHTQSGGSAATSDIMYVPQTTVR